MTLHHHCNFFIKLGLFIAWLVLEDCFSPKAFQINEIYFQQKLFKHVFGQSQEFQVRCDSDTGLVQF